MVNNESIHSAIIEPYWLESFDFKSIEELKSEYQITLEEKASCVSKIETNEELIQNGFMNMVEVLDYPLRGKPTYLRFVRRRWKDKNNKNSYANEYEFHIRGAKVTKEFGLFLKELDRRELHEFFVAWPDIRYIREEDFPLVS